MPTLYVKHTGSNTAPYDTWAKAATLLNTAVSAAAAGDTIYVSHAHVESQAVSIIYTSPGTAASRLRILCVNDGTGALANTATVTTTSNNTINFTTGYAYIYGIIFSAGAGGAGTAGVNFTSAGSGWRLENCTLKTAITSTGPITIGASSATHNDILVEFKNVIVQFAAVGQSITCGASFTWDGGSLAGATVPTTLFKGTPRGEALVKVRGVDLSVAGSGKNLLDLAAVNRIVLECTDCKLGSGVTLATGSPTSPASSTAKFVNCDSTDAYVNYSYQDYFGTVSHDTVVYRTGGATDGTTSFARRMISSANVSFEYPLYSEWMYFWNDAIGSGINVSCAFTAFNSGNTGISVTEGEAWLEVEYMANSGFPLGGFLTDRGGDIITPGATSQATDASSSWVTTGITSPTFQKFDVAITPQEIGWVRSRVVLAKPSTRIVYCPKILATASRVYMTETGLINMAGSANTQKSFCSME